MSVSKLAEFFAQELAAKGRSFNFMSEEEVSTWNAIQGAGPPTPESEALTRRWQQAAESDPATFGNPLAGQDSPGDSLFDSLKNVVTSVIPGHSNFLNDLDNFKNFEAILQEVPGLGILALPFAAAGGAALVGGAGAGAGATGTAAGTGGTFGGLEALSAASPELFGEAAAAAAGAGATGLPVTGVGAPLASALSDLPATGAGPESAVDFGGFDPGAEGIFNAPTTPANTLFPNGMDPSALQQVQDFAKQYGLTPANALKLLQGAGGAGGTDGVLGAIARGIPGVLGAVGANQQANSLSALADKYMALGAPSRERYEASFRPGFDMTSDPGYQGALDQSAKATQHALSVRGNPAGSPNAWAQSLEDLYAKTAYPALQNFRNTNSNAGGISSLQTAAPGAAAGAIQSQGDIFNAIGGAANDIFNPKPAQTSLEDLLKLLQTKKVAA